MDHRFFPTVTTLFVLLALILYYIFHKKNKEKRQVIGLVCNNVDTRWKAFNKHNPKIKEKWQVIGLVGNNVDTRWKAFNKHNPKIKEKWQVIGLVGNNVDTRWKAFNKHNPKIIVTPCQEYFPRETNIRDIPMDDKFLETYLTNLIDSYENDYDKVITNKKKYDCIFIDRATIHGLFIDLQIPNNLRNKAYWNAVKKLKTSIHDHYCGAVRKHILALLLIVKCTKSLKHGGKLIFDNNYLGTKHFDLIKACFNHEKKFNDTGNHLDLMANKNNIPNFVELVNFRPKKAWLDNFKQYVVQNGVENNDLSKHEMPSNRT